MVQFHSCPPRTLVQGLLAFGSFRGLIRVDGLRCKSVIHPATLSSTDVQSCASDNGSEKFLSVSVY